MEQRRCEDLGDVRPIQRGWCLGSDAFCDRLLALLGDKIGEHHYGDELREADEERAKRIVREELQGAGLGNEDLLARRKADPIKVRLAARLRAETTVNWRWIAEQLSRVIGAQPLMQFVFCPSKKTEKFWPNEGRENIPLFIPDPFMTPSWPMESRRFNQ